MKLGFIILLFALIYPITVLADTEHPLTEARLKFKADDYSFDKPVQLPFLTSYERRQIEKRLPKFEYDILNGIDANELFITSNTVKNILENKKNKTTVLVRKAEGIKCSRCWKILKKKCERNHCPIKQN